MLPWLLMFALFILRVGYFLFLKVALWVSRGALSAPEFFPSLLTHLFFSFKYILNAGSFEVHVAGGLIMLLGGILTLIDIYIEYKNWVVPK
ncbi:MAG: hypothetical protein QXT67_07685 [Candidatus Bathyarchaeia archaeon]